MTTRDRELIRDLARQIAEIAADPVQEERRQVWYTQNALQPVRPPIFISPEGSWSELLTPAALQCEDDDARGLEHGLRMKLYAWEHFADDQVLDDESRVPYAVTNTDWGIAVPTHYSDAPRGAYVTLYWLGPDGYITVPLENVRVPGERNVTVDTGGIIVPPYGREQWVAIATLEPFPLGCSGEAAMLANIQRRLKVAHGIGRWEVRSHEGLQPPP